VKHWAIKSIGVTIVRFRARFNSGFRHTGADSFSSLFTQLQEAEVKLQEAAGDLEVRFLSTGSGLEQLAGFGDEFVKQVEKMVGMASGKDFDHSLFATAFALIEEATRFLVSCQQQTDDLLAQLRGYNTQIKDLLATEGELERTMLPLKFMQTLFKAESAPLGDEVQQTFTALTKEMESLHSQVRDIFGTKFKQLEQTGQTIAGVVTQLDQQARSLKQVTAAHKTQIEISLQTLRKEIASNYARDVRLAVLSRDFAREVEQVVIGLQFQDIINQKLQHVSAALPQIEETFSRLQHESRRPAAGGPWQFLQQSCQLEAGQLLSAQEELANAENNIQCSVQKVLTQMTAMDSRALSLDEFKKLTTSFDGMVQVLLDMIAEVRDLVAASVAGASRAYDLLEPLGGLASDLTGVVRSASFRIRLIGLNAQVQAACVAHGCRGAGLEVLSARTSEISNETNRISEAAATQLDALSAGLAAGVKAFGQLRAEGLAQQSVLNLRGRAEEHQLHAFRDRALETLRGIGSALDAIRIHAEQTLATIDFSESHQVTLPAVRVTLLALAHLAEQRLAARGISLSEGNMVEGFKRDYTMASERSVHAKVIAPAPAAAATSHEFRPPGLSDPGELTPPAFHPADEGDLGTHAGVGTRSTASLIAAPEGGLGANVELF